ncbi:PTS lactose/cellobiose transporter subunit IIA [Vagococcus zengguangii]|uniref:PTS lactose/cellobiose transporter subunit IIA n=1 Tax=Vagococcus zengguangii TaxID=2571750 RepID=A0A4D7CUB9_9ENTE|nr:PTS lactose/cellobiose transporter subunit IIA [Vagococcus zengguangii]QCI86622.1 PTS lactose/cellobiose transporter subunit IIA [Vagococcus zengguangii]TLG79743.1 PTS lactose/cellobiose transporter subunit IIA [Vagococcus zengguangii]
MKDNELVMVAMEIILHAGDARLKIEDSLKEAKTFNFDLSENLMEEANKEIVLAHKSQTNVIQNEASGKNYGSSLLFNHAQDTLMTINSEVRMANHMIDILKIISNLKENE